MADPDRTKLNLNKPSGPSSTLEDSPNLQKRPNLRDKMLAKATISLLKTQHPQVGYLFNCHQAPSDAEETMIRGYIKEAKEQKKLLGEPAGRYTYGERSRIYAHNKHQLEVTIAYWKILLAPIRRVPPEILAHIFTLTGPWTHDRKRCTCNDYHHHLIRAPPCVGAPLPLLHVCRFWRNVAESTRSLWERLPDIEIASVKPKEAERRLALLRKCVDLGKQNFSVFIRGPEWEHGWTCSPRSLGLPLDSEGPSRDLIDFIGQTCHLWVDCTISCPSTPAQHLKNIIGKLPRLQSVTLICPDIFDHPPPNPHVDVDLFQNAPLLRILNLKGRYNAYINVPMPQLLHVKDHFHHDHVMSHLLDSPLFVNLVDLDLVDRFVHDGWHPPTMMINFPRLEKLQMSCLQDMETGLMPRMIFPRLVSLSVVSVYRQNEALDIGDIFGVIERALTRSGCLSLETLLIHAGIDVDERDQRTPLSSLLSATPSLLHLDIIAHLEDLQSVGTHDATSQLQSCIIRPLSQMNRETAKAISQIVENLGLSAYQKSNSYGHDIVNLEKVSLRIRGYKPPSRPVHTFLADIPRTTDCDSRHPPPLQYFVTPAVLEDWPSLGFYKMQISKLIHKIDSDTYQLGGGCNVYETKSRRCGSYPPQICSHTEELLSEIESLLSGSVERVLASNIHVIIARLAARALDNSLAAFGQIYNSGGKFPNAWIVFRRRLLRILRGWHTTLMKEPLDDVHWVWSRTSDEVLYVPNGADIRLDKALWAATILGVPELSETRRKDSRKALKHRLTAQKQ